MFVSQDVKCEVIGSQALKCEEVKHGRRKQDSI
nr:MAG TPA: hypothetical protein [Caudoviricetes sp.]